jgi:hypothetical protein
MKLSFFLCTVLEHSSDLKSAQNFGFLTPILTYLKKLLLEGIFLFFRHENAKSAKHKLKKIYFSNLVFRILILIQNG